MAKRNINVSLEREIVDAVQAARDEELERTGRRPSFSAVVESILRDWRDSRTGKEAAPMQS